MVQPFQMKMRFDQINDWPNKFGIKENIKFPSSAAKSNALYLTLMKKSFPMPIPHNNHLIDFLVAFAQH
ncbi:hypothetical protein BLOT_009822 [Blomia tropicalis]|nr:hypothetical protein BLOT_009822 [Blomia tropicalis]